MNQLPLKDSEKPDVRTAFVLENIPTLTRTQLKHWIDNKWIQAPVRSIKTGLPTAGATRHIPYKEYIKLKYMAYLVNEVGMYPSIARKLAAECTNLRAVQKEKVWIDWHGTLFGIPLIEEHKNESNGY